MAIQFHNLNMHDFFVLIFHEEDVYTIPNYIVN